MGGGSVERRVRAVRGAEDAEITMGLLGFEIAARPMRDYPRPCPRVGRRTLPMPSLLAHGPLWLASLAVALLVTGAFTGFVAGMLGVGGGIVMVPFLLQLFAFLGVDESIRMHLVLGTSLASILPTAITSGRAHARRGAVDKLTLGHWAPSLLIGSALGTLVAGQARGSVLTIGFGVLATGIAIDLLRKRTDAVKASREQGNPERTRSRPWLQRVLALGVGGLSALLGVGGGGDQCAASDRLWSSDLACRRDRGRVRRVRGAARRHRLRMDRLGQPAAAARVGGLRALVGGGAADADDGAVRADRGRHGAPRQHGRLAKDLRGVPADHGGQDVGGSGVDAGLGRAED
jgi:hypothetical protein